MLAGIRDILIISTPKDLPRFQDLFGSGRDLGLRFSYAAQKEPRGIAESFIIGASFIGSDPVALILGDNIFYGHDLTQVLSHVSQLKKGAMVFGYYVRDPGRYGVISFDKKCRVTSVTEKPKNPASNWAVTGLYFYDNDVLRIARTLKPSARGELEITSVNNAYLKKRRLSVKLLGRGFAWLDTGTYDSLIDASIFIKTIEERQGLKVGCIEEIAFRMGMISKDQLGRLAQAIPTSYGLYLKRILDEEK
jgi:glucose-1-phosphate thymidylyltransferase